MRQNKLFLTWIVTGKRVAHNELFAILVPGTNKVLCIEQYCVSDYKMIDMKY